MLEDWGKFSITREKKEVADLQKYGVNPKVILTRKKQVAGPSPWVDVDDLREVNTRIYVEG
jgi:hypothetical protein